MKVLVRNADKCTGCRLCELACSFGHTGLFKPSVARIKVSLFTKEGYSVPLVCQQCSKAACMEVCEPGAISKNERTGALSIDLEKCTGCKQCLMACPYGGMGYDEAADNPIACDFCGGEPQCVEFCQSGALVWADIDLAQQIRGGAHALSVKEAEAGPAQG